MIKAYEAIIMPDDLGYSVTFPDIPGCSTQGNDLSDAYVMAYDALGLILQEFCSKGASLPIATYGHTAPQGGHIAVIVLNSKTLDFTEEYVTIRQTSDMLGGISSQRIQALIKSGDLISRKVGTSRLIDQQSVIDYRSRRKGAGRPKNVATL